jgi:hypothetical protein
VKSYFNPIDPELAARVAKGLGVELPVDELLPAR